MGWLASCYILCKMGNEYVSFIPQGDILAGEVSLWVTSINIFKAIMILKIVQRYCLVRERGKVVRIWGGKNEQRNRKWGKKIRTIKKKKTEELHGDRSQGKREFQRVNGQYYLVLNLQNSSNIYILPFPLNLGISSYQWYLWGKRS